MLTITVHPKTLKKVFIWEVFPITTFLCGHPKTATLLYLDLIKFILLSTNAQHFIKIRELTEIA